MVLRLELGEGPWCNYPYFCCCANTMWCWGIYFFLVKAEGILCGVGCTFSVAMAWEFFVVAHDGSVLVQSTVCSMTRVNHGH